MFDISLYMCLYIHTYIYIYMYTYTYIFIDAYARLFTTMETGGTYCSGVDFGSTGMSFFVFGRIPSVCSGVGCCLASFSRIVPQDSISNHP